MHSFRSQGMPTAGDRARIAVSHRTACTGSPKERAMREDERISTAAFVLLMAAFWLLTVITAAVV